MQSNRQPGFLLILTVALMGLLPCGCEKPKSDVAVNLRASTAEKATMNIERDTGFNDASISKLIRIAEFALAENDIDTVTKSMTEFQNRDSKPWGSKMEAARILYATGDMKGAVALYDEVLQEQPDIKPLLWQRGLALYYVGEFEKGVDQFDTHQTYNSQDVENSVWQLLCQAKLTSVDEARKSMIQIQEDSRIPMKQVFDMFAGTGSPQDVFDACGYQEDMEPRDDSSIYHGLFYVGLFYEMTGDVEASNRFMIKSLSFKPIIPGLMGHVAEGHLRARKAYPDDQDN